MKISAEQGAPLADLAYVQGRPTAQGIIRAATADFRVDEVLGYEPDGEGSHVWLRVRKTGCNTDWVARLLGRFARVKPVDVGFAGLKDRHAVATQWFSVNLAGKTEPDWSELDSSELVVEQAVRHGRKLRRGGLAGNRFEIVVQDFKGDAGEVSQRLERIARDGVPNYFGEQRFGRNGANLEQAAAMFEGRLSRLPRHKRSLYLSAARSHLFNQVLSKRVEQANWAQPLPGDVMMLDGSRSTFIPDAIDEIIQRRMAEQDIHPTGALWGRGNLPSGGEVRALEVAVAATFNGFAQGLEQAGLEQERRSLRLKVEDLEWAFQGESLALQFALPAGAYATTVLREIGNFKSLSETAGY